MNNKKDNNSPIQEKFEPNFRRGSELLQRGEAEKAVRLLERAYKLDPDHIGAATNLAGAYILTRRFKEAVRLLEPISEAFPEYAMVWTNLGAAYLGNPILAKDQDQIKAISAFEKALQLNPAAPNVAYNIGLIYRDRKETEEALRWFKKAVRANPHDQDARRLIKKLEAIEGNK